MPDGQVLAIAALGAILFFAGHGIVKVTKVGAVKSAHAVEKVVTLGHHPKRKFDCDGNGDHKTTPTEYRKLF